MRDEPVGIGGVESALIEGTEIVPGLLQPEMLPSARELFSEPRGGAKIYGIIGAAHFAFAG